MAAYVTMTFSYHSNGRLRYYDVCCMYVALVEVLEVSVSYYT